MNSTAVVTTPLATRYLTQLCKHFEHKLPVTLTPGEGRIGFSAGECRLLAAGETLTLQVEAADADLLATLEGVVERHLQRFAFRDPPVLHWQHGKSAVDAPNP